MRRRTMQALLLAYVAASALVVIPLVLDLAGDLSATTSGKILAAALVSLAAGAALAVRDPFGHRVVIQMLIAFLSLAAVAMVYRLVYEGHPLVPTALVLLVDLAAAALFIAFYPRSPEA